MKTNINKLAILVLIAFISCSSPKEYNEFHPMVDGSKLDWIGLKVEPIKISEEVSLYIFQNSSYVWLGYDYPEGSFGTLDMIIETKKIEEPLNLHVSAQLGEWKVGDEESIPKLPTSELWWNNDGWIANNLWANGIDTESYETPELKLRNGEMREIQLSKDRFGRGEWKFKLNINAIKNIEGNFVSLVFPNDEAYFLLNVS